MESRICGRGTFRYNEVGMGVGIHWKMSAKVGIYKWVVVSDGRSVLVLVLQPDEVSIVGSVLADNAFVSCITTNDGELVGGMGWNVSFVI